MRENQYSISGYSSDAAVLKATTATPGRYTASRPLEVVQIDHTKVDVIVVDEESSEPHGRPWLTLAMDVFTRMVTGFYLTATILIGSLRAFGAAAWNKAGRSTT